MILYQKRPPNATATPACIAAVRPESPFYAISTRCLCPYSQKPPNITATTPAPIANQNSECETIAAWYIVATDQPSVVRYPTKIAP